MLMFRRLEIEGIFLELVLFEGSQIRTYKLSFCITHSSRYEFVLWGELCSGCLYIHSYRNKSDRFVMESCLLLVNKDKSTNE